MSGLMSLMPLLIVVPFVLLLLWSSRSQDKKRKQAVEELKKGDRVILQSGLVGKLVQKGERISKIELAAGVKVEVLTSVLVGRDTGDLNEVPDRR